jgi:hypothetical protein
MRIKTQNMIVLTVEFTRIPLSRRGRSRFNDLRHRPLHPYIDATTFCEVTESVVALNRRHEEPLPG